MRVTHNLMHRQMVQYLFADLERLQRAQEVVGTGKRILKPSDDPADAALVLGHSARIAASEQYQRNAEAALGWNQATSAVLTAVEELLQEMYDISVAVSHSVATSAERLQAADQIEGLLSELVLKANSKYQERHLFGGTETQDAPFIANVTDGEITSVTQNPDGIDERFYVDLDEGDPFPVNLSGSAAFQPGGVGAADDVFQVAIDLREALQANDLDAVHDAEDRIRQGFGGVATCNAAVGSKIDAVERRVEALDVRTVDERAERSRLEDADMLQAVFDFNTAQNVYRAALAASARMIELSLLNFLR